MKNPADEEARKEEEEKEKRGKQNEQQEESSVGSRFIQQAKSGTRRQNQW